MQDSACGENRPRADFTAALTKNKSGWEASEVATPSIIVVTWSLFFVYVNMHWDEQNKETKIMPD